MSLNSLDSAQLSSHIHHLLEQSPDGQSAALKTSYDQLESFPPAAGDHHVESALELMGTALGKNRAWQAPFQEAGILHHVLDRLGDANSSVRLKKQYLRIIGNCVADNDTTREVAIKGLLSITDCLQVEELLPVALAVSFNLCNDYDPAKAAAAVIRLDHTISQNLASGRVPEGALEYATDLLTWTTEKLNANQFNDDVSLETFGNILKVALQYDEDHYQEYVAIVVHYLQDSEFQLKVATPELLNDLIVLMLDFEARITPEESDATFKELAISKDAEKTVSDETNVLLLAQLIGSVSGISATDAFARDFDIRSPVVEMIRAKLSTPAHSPSTVCACVMLGNLAMSDEICMDMVNIMELHVTLMKILSSCNEPALLYPAAGFMRHLTFPEANRDVLADAGLIQICVRLLRQTDASVRGEAAAIICKLVTNNLHNIVKVVSETVGRTVVPDTHNVAGLELSSELTILHQIVTQALAPSGPLPSTAMKNPSIELGRSIVTILRYLGRSDAEQNVDAVRQQMLKVPLIARPVARLVRQRFYADARSEGLLGLGLMAQSPEGAALVIGEMQEDSGLLEAIKDFANGKDGGADQQSGSATGRDYQNAVVLLQALQNNWGSDMDQDLRDQVRALQEELGKLMV